MRVIIQRVSAASVTIDNVERAAIGRGLLILLGIEASDSEEDASKLAAKIPKLRIFNDAEGLMNLSCSDIDGDYLVVSQFTLHAQTKKGNRPSYIRAARPEHAIPLYEKFKQLLASESNKPVLSGEFGADMKVAFVNDGPVTIYIDTQNWE
jgi:D-aminoacyl-tRNA deacylase